MYEGRNLRVCDRKTPFLCIWNVEATLLAYLNLKKRKNHQQDKKKRERKCEMIKKSIMIKGTDRQTDIVLT